MGQWNFCNNWNALYRYNQNKSLEMFCKKNFLEILQSLQEHTCARVAFLIKLQALACNFIKRETLSQYYLLILRNFSEYSGGLLLYNLPQSLTHFCPMFPFCTPPSPKTPEYPSESPEAAAWKCSIEQVFWKNYIKITRKQRISSFQDIYETSAVSKSCKYLKS